MQLDLDFVRSQFPALSGDWIFLDNAGGSQTLKQVGDRVRDYLLNTNVQLGASYEISQISTDRVNQSIDAISDLINANEPSEVILGSSTSMLLKILSLTLGETFEAGDEVVVTNCDHEANIGCWRSLEKRAINVKEWQVNPETLELHLEDLEQLMTPKTRLVALTHASNILGTINPIKEIASFVHNRGALICVDGVAYAPHRKVDVRELDVDFYAFSFYKVYGPHYAMLYGKKELLETLPGINHFFLENDIPYKFQPGNVNYELSYSLLGLKDYLIRFAQTHTPVKQPEPLSLNTCSKYAFNTIAQYEETLSKRLLDFLNNKPNVRIIGKTTYELQQRVPTISFVVNNIKSSTIPPQVDKHNIGIRFGDFYAKRLIRDLVLEPQDGVIRVSMVHYNSLQEIDRLVEILDLLF
jgi:cysteine desulfurase family protein (TIGR01976 family)